MFAIFALGLRHSSWDAAFLPLVSKYFKLISLISITRFLFKMNVYTLDAIWKSVQKLEHSIAVRSFHLPESRTREWWCTSSVCRYYTGTRWWTQRQGKRTIAEKWFPRWTPAAPDWLLRWTCKRQRVHWFGPTGPLLLDMLLQRRRTRTERDEVGPSYPAGSCFRAGITAQWVVDALGSGLLYEDITIIDYLWN